MSSEIVKREVNNIKVRQVLEDTGFAYTLSCESQHLNTDYADFASTQSLRRFKKALKNPDLTYEDLCVMLRKASRRASARQCNTPWSMFMANYIAKHNSRGIQNNGSIKH